MGKSASKSVSESSTTSASKSVSKSKFVDSNVTSSLQSKCPCGNRQLISKLQQLYDNDIYFKQLCIGERDLNSPLPFSHEFMVFLYGKHLKDIPKNESIKYFKYIKYFRIDLYDEGLKFSEGYVSEYFDTEEHKNEVENLKHKITHASFSSKFNIDPKQLITALDSIKSMHYNVATWNCKQFVKYMLNTLGIEIVIEEEKQSFIEYNELNICTNINETRAIHGTNDMQHIEFDLLWDGKVKFVPWIPWNMNQKSSHVSNNTTNNRRFRKYTEDLTRDSKYNLKYL